VAILRTETMVLSIPPNEFSVYKGIIWILFAAGAGLIAVASIMGFLALFAHGHCILQVFVYLDQNRIFFFPIYPEGC